MKRSTIIIRLCYFLGEGYGINSALAELGLPTTFLTKRLRRSDRRKLHQAAAIYREKLQCEVIQRARLGRATGQLERALDNLPPLSLPGDDEDEERAHRKGRRNFAGDDVEIDTPHDTIQSLADVRRLLGLGIGDDPEHEADEATEDEAEASPKGPSSPRRRLQTNETPSTAPNPHPSEDAHQRRREGMVAKEPRPKPKLRWYRLFTGRAVQRDEHGSVVRSVMPDQAGYPHHTEFVNWD